MDEKSKILANLFNEDKYSKYIMSNSQVLFEPIFLRSQYIKVIKYSFLPSQPHSRMQVNNRLQPNYPHQPQPIASQLLPSILDQHYPPPPLPQIYHDHSEHSLPSGNRFVPPSRAFAQHSSSEVSEYVGLIGQRNSVVTRYQEPMSTRSSELPSTNKQLQVNKSQRQLDPSEMRPVRKVCCSCWVNPPSGRLTLCLHQDYCLRCAQTKVLQDLRQNRRKVPTCGFPMNISHIDRPGYYTQQKCKAKIALQDSLFQRFHHKTRKLIISAYEYSLSPQRYHQTKVCCIQNCMGLLILDMKKCNMCSTKYCSVCWKPQHHGSCQLPSYVEPEQFSRYAKCFKCQQRLVYENDGCARVTCSICQEGRCKICGEEWEFRHHWCQEGGLWTAFTHFFRQNCCPEQNANIITGFEQQR